MQLSFQDVLTKLKNKEPFAFSRWGDGEWICLLQNERAFKKGKPRSNCDGHTYFPDLGEALGNVLKSNPSYYLGMQPLARRIMGDEIEAWQKDNGVNIDWCGSEIFHEASAKREFYEPFMDALKGRTVIMVGPQHLGGGPWDVHIRVPLMNAWESNYEISVRLAHLVEQNPEDFVVLFAAGMTSNVLLHEIKCISDDWGQHDTFIDIGSVLDPYFGKKSRKYHYGLKLSTTE